MKIQENLSTPEPAEADNAEIDYVKLQRCIVQAINESKEKGTNGRHDTREWMKWILNLLFGSIIVMTGGISIIAIINVFKFAEKFSSGHSALSIGYMIQLAMNFFVFMFSFSLVMISILARREIEKEMDACYVASIFSGTISVVALIIAVLALLKGELW